MPGDYAALERRMPGKSLEQAARAVAAAIAGERVTFIASDLARAAKDIVKASKAMHVYVKIFRDDENGCLRVTS